jgi:hypothetical protein
MSKAGCGVVSCCGRARLATCLTLLGLVASTGCAASDGLLLSANVGTAAIDFALRLPLLKRVSAISRELAQAQQPPALLLYAVEAEYPEEPTTAAQCDYASA